ncbi:MAG: hypothetical protein KGY99_05515 [Phycisphaerae bacterium]|nr:hypothetical protein [Phycisphaerae bacterium]
MNPSTAQGEAAPAAEALVPSRLLDDGEAVILAIKPSGWFVLLASWPAVVLAGLLAAGVSFAGGSLGVAQPAAVLACAAAALLRLVVACLQWLARIYVLTDKRVMRIRGVLRVDVVQCALKNIDRTELIAGRGERFFALGTLVFDAENLEPAEAAWTNVARPDEVKRLVDDTIQRRRLVRRAARPDAS